MDLGPGRESVMNREGGVLRRGHRDLGSNRAVEFRQVLGHGHRPGPDVPARIEVENHRDDHVATGGRGGSRELYFGPDAIPGVVELGGGVAVKSEVKLSQGGGVGEQEWAQDDQGEDRSESVENAGVWSHGNGIVRRSRAEEQSGWGRPPP